MAKGKEHESHMALTLPGLGVPCRIVLCRIWRQEGGSEPDSALPHMATGKGQGESELALTVPGSGRCMPDSVWHDMARGKWRCADVLPEALSDFGEGRPACKLRLDCVTNDVTVESNAKGSLLRIW